MSAAPNYSNPLLLLSWDQLYSLDRQTIRAHRMEIDWSSAGVDKKRTDPTFKEYADLSLIAFAILFGGDSKKRLSIEDWFVFINVTPAGIYFSVWLGLLYEVIKKLRSLLKKHGITDLGFIESYTPELFAKLDGIRNTVFHVSNEYWDQGKLHSVLEPGIAKRAWRLHKELMNEISRALKKVEQEEQARLRFERMLTKLSE